MLQPRPPPRERVGVAVAGAVDTEGARAPCPRGGDCDGGQEHPGRSRVDRTALHHLLHLRPRDNSSAALHRHTERKEKISSNRRDLRKRFFFIYRAPRNLRTTLLLKFIDQLTNNFSLSLSLKRLSRNNQRK